MQFEWHEPKSQECLELRKFDFNEAARIFKDENLKVEIDGRKDYGETRHRAFGKIDEKKFCVVFTMRDNKIRIISARRVRENSKEARKYYENS